MAVNPGIETVTLTIRDGVSTDHFAALDKAVEREHVAGSRASSPGSQPLAKMPTGW
jgi:hypothetical protein